MILRGEDGEKSFEGKPRASGDDPMTWAQVVQAFA